MGNGESQPAHGHSHDKKGDHGHSHSHGEHSHSSSDSSECSGDEKQHGHSHDKKGDHGHSHDKKGDHGHSHSHGGNKDCSDDSHSESDDEGHGHSHSHGGSHSHSHGEKGQGEKAQVHKKFDDPKYWEKLFEAPERDAFQKPKEVIAAMGIKESTSIADIGAATGYFPTRFAAAAPKGKVFAIDIEEKMVAYLREKTSKTGSSNIFALQGSKDDPHIPEPVDIIFCCQTYHHIENRSLISAN